MIRKHTRSNPDMSFVDKMLNWRSASRIGAELAFLAEEVSSEKEFPAAELALEVPDIFESTGYEPSSRDLVCFWRSSRAAYRTEQSLYLVEISPDSSSKRRKVHLFLKFFQKRAREPFQTMHLTMDVDQKVTAFGFRSDMK